MHKAQELPKEQVKWEVERHLTGQESEPSELVYFKVYKPQIPVIEEALEVAAMLLGSDRSRGYRLEMICADFLSGTRHTDRDQAIGLAVGGLPNILPHGLQKCERLPYEGRSPNASGLKFFVDFSINAKYFGFSQFIEYEGIGFRFGGIDNAG